MASGAGGVASGAGGEPAVAVAGDVEAVGRIARWLLLAMAADLLISRFVVRLAMVIPKEGPVATLAAVGGRVAAVTDTLVAILAMLLVGALVVRAWRGASPTAGLAALATGLVAAGGLVMLWVPPSPMLAMLMGLTVVVAACAAGVEGWRARSMSTGGRVTIGLLAMAVGCAGLRSLLGVLGVGSVTSGPGGSAAMLAAATGEAAYVAGAMVIGLMGVVHARRLGAERLRRSLLVAALVAGLVLVAWVRAPSSWDALMIWSVGLTGAVPVPITAVVAGVTVAGLLALRDTAPRLVRGVAIVLLAGSGLAASGLILASLAGLAVATTDGDPPSGDHGRSPSRRPASQAS